jgi:hypothetical protein
LLSFRIIKEKQGNPERRGPFVSDTTDQRRAEDALR